MNNLYASRGMAAVLTIMLLGSTSIAVGNAEHKAAGGHPRLGEQTRVWLEYQHEGKSASSQSQALPPAVEARIMQRYLDSFTHPIPEEFYPRDQLRQD